MLFGSRLFSGTIAELGELQGSLGEVAVVPRAAYDLCALYETPPTITGVGNFAGVLWVHPSVCLRQYFSLQVCSMLYLLHFFLHI